MSLPHHRTVRSDHDNRSDAGQYGSDPTGLSTAISGEPATGRAACRGSSPALIDGIIVGIVSLVLFLVTDTLSNYWVTGLFTGLLTFVYFVAFETARDGRPARSCSACACTAPAARRSRRRSSPRSATRGRCCRSFRSSAACSAFIAIIVIAVTINSSPTKQGKHDELAGGTQVVKG